MQANNIKSVLLDLGKYCREQNWKGYDPYDGLISKFFQGQRLSNRFCKLAIVQLNRLSPLNLRNLLKIEKRVDLKSVSIFSRAFLELYKVWKSERSSELKKQAKQCLVNLETFRSPHSKNFSIGANRPIQMASYYIDPDEPCPFITLLAGEAFLKAYKVIAEQHYLDLAVSAGNYFVDELTRTEVSPKEIYFHYMPNMEKKIYNLNALIGNFLTKLAKVIGNDRFFTLGEKAIMYTINCQNGDGSWFYGEETRYIDNYHTVFVLSSLIESNQILQDTNINEAIRSGLKYYREYLVKEKRKYVIPIHFDRRYPPLNSNLISRVDIRDCAMAIVLFSKLSISSSQHKTLADKILQWTFENMMDKEGFYFERTWFWTNKIKYISLQAYMLYALGEYLNNVD